MSDSISKSLAQTRQKEAPQYYAPEDDCTTGLCDMEGLFIPHVVGNFALDQEFAGSQIDTELALDLANIDTFPLSDELFPPILDVAPITLAGLMDCFARYYPERAQLLATLVEKNGYSIEWLETPNQQELHLQQQLDSMPREHQEWHGNSYVNTYNAAQKEERKALNHRLVQIQHWRITENKILLMPRINKNIDKFNWQFGMDDDDLIYQYPTNLEGARWLNQVMGDWMARNGIPGATKSEEFTDSYSSRVTWGSLNVVLGAAEVVGGVLLIPTGSASFGAGAVAGTAMTIAGVEAFTQGIDMLSTPAESAHSTGWLGDGVKAMATQFGHTTTDNYASFDKYWSFAMLGLSLGGAGVVAALPKAATKVALGNAQSVFHYAVDARPLTHARKALAGVKNATFGNFKANFVTLPSARTLFNIEGVGRVVVASWESLARLRWRFIVDDGLEAAERNSKLGKGEAGLISLRDGIQTPADARKLVEEAALAVGISAKRLKKLITKVEVGELGSRSAFTPKITIRIRRNIGAKLDGSGEYNEFMALTETIHEVRHAMRYKERIAQGMKHNQLWPEKFYPKYWQEEVLVETYAQSRMRSIVEPRIAQEIQHGNKEKAEELESLFKDAIFESNKVIDHAKIKQRRLSGQ